MATIDQIKAKLIASKSRGNNNNGGNRQAPGGDNASYPFWNIPFDSSATLRLLPDGDPSNDFFWVDKQTINLPFEGVVGGDYPTDRPVTIRVPCVDMFEGMSCPIIAATRPWWKDPAKEALARQYWKKRSYIFQGFVVNSPFEEQFVPENPIRRFIFNPSIFEIIEKSLMSPEMEDMPVDYVGGRDFKVAKTKRGEYANYSSSSWSFKVRSLSEAELTAIDKYGLWDLKQYKGRKPDSDELEALKAMFEDSVEGKPFDMDSYGKWYRPYGSRDEGSDNRVASAASAVAARPAPAAAASSYGTSAPEPSAPSAPVAESAPARTAAPNPAEILERIRQRTAK